MSKARTVSFVHKLYSDQVDSDLVDRYYTDSIYGKSVILLSHSTQAVAAETSTIDFPNTATEIEEVFWDGHRLSQTDIRELESISADWRKHRGVPCSWLEEGETDHVFRLYPTPDVGGSLELLYADAREDGPDWHDFCSSFWVLSKEFARLSDHHSPELAQFASQIYERMLALLI